MEVSAGSGEEISKPETEEEKVLPEIRIEAEKEEELVEVTEHFFSSKK